MWRSPHECKACIWWGAARCPEGIVCNTAITTSVPCGLGHDASHLGLGGPQSCLPSKDVPPPRRGRLGLDFGGEVEEKFSVMWFCKFKTWRGFFSYQEKILSNRMKMLEKIMWPGAHGTLSFPLPFCYDLISALDAFLADCRGSLSQDYS